MEIVALIFNFCRVASPQWGGLFAGIWASVNGVHRSVLEGHAVVSREKSDRLHEISSSPLFKLQHAVVTSHAVGAAGHALHTAFGA